MRDIGVYWFALLLGVAILPHMLAGLVGRRPKDPTPPRSHIRTYVLSVVAYGVLGAATLVLDLGGSRRGLVIATTLPPLEVFAAWTFWATALCVAISGATILSWRRKGRPSSGWLAAVLPRGPGEQVVVYAGTVAAVVVDEYVMRAYFIAVLAAATGSALIAVALVSLLFTLMHGGKDLPSAIRGIVRGAILGVTVLATGALLPAVVARLISELASLASAPLVLGRLDRQGARSA